MVTIKDIAKKSGFSAATVSRLLNADPNLSVSKTTKTKILKVASELGYWKKKAKPTKYVFALLYRVNGQEHLEDQYFLYLKRALIKMAKNQQVELTVFTEIKTLIKQADDFQGFLGIGSAELTKKDLIKLHQVLPNGVFIDINPAPSLFDSVQPNLSWTIQDALVRLKKAGYQEVGYIGAASFSLDNVFQRDIREITFSEYSRYLGFDQNLVISHGIVSVENGYHLAQMALKQWPKLPKAIIVASDTLSVGVLQAFNAKGIKIPEDVSIISINNNEIARYVSPPLSSYNIDQNELSKLALNTLLSNLNEPDRPRIHLLMNTNLIKRKSFN